MEDNPTIKNPGLRLARLTWSYDTPSRPSTALRFDLNPWYYPHQKCPVIAILLFGTEWCTNVRLKSTTVASCALCRVLEYQHHVSFYLICHECFEEASTYQRHFHFHRDSLPASPEMNLELLDVPVHVPVCSTEQERMFQIICETAANQLNLLLALISFIHQDKQVRCTYITIQVFIQIHIHRFHIHLYSYSDIRITFTYSYKQIPYSQIHIPIFIYSYIHICDVDLSSYDWTPLRQKLIYDIMLRFLPIPSWPRCHLWFPIPRKTNSSPIILGSLDIWVFVFNLAFHCCI